MIRRDDLEDGSYMISGGYKKQKISGDDFIDLFNKLHPISSSSVMVGVKQGNATTRQNVTTLHEALAAILDYLKIDLVYTEPSEKKLSVVKRSAK